jgi:hypothetical protein
MLGGEGGIRTPEPLRANGFQDRRIRPLCHLSAKALSEPRIGDATEGRLYGGVARSVAIRCARAVRAAPA